MLSLRHPPIVAPNPVGGKGRKVRGRASDRARRRHVRYASLATIAVLPSLPTAREIAPALKIDAGVDNGRIVFPIGNERA